MSNTEFQDDVLLRSIEIRAQRLGNVSISIISFQSSCSPDCTTDLSNLCSGNKNLDKRYTIQANWIFELTNTTNLFVLNYDKFFERGSMVLYSYDNESGRIGFEDSSSYSVTIAFKNFNSFNKYLPYRVIFKNYLWDVSNKLNALQGFFHVNLTSELFLKKLQSHSTNKMYSYPGTYYLTCHFDDFINFTSIITVQDGS